MKFSLKMKKYILFATVFVVWLVADLVTKNWADSTLANRNHPLPVHVVEADAGKTLGEVLKAELGWDDEELEKRLVTDVELLEPAGGYAANDRPFDRTGPAAGASGFYVFWRGAGVPPRRFRANERGLMTRWLRLAFPSADTNAVHDAVEKRLGDMTFSDWLPDKIMKLDADAVSAFAATGIHPIRAGLGPLDAARKVAAGETYLLMNNRVDVMGDWFKLLYAENPGAAFGFMKGVPASTRFTLFTLLTLLAFVVILYIVYRLPPEGWFVYVAFAGILSGAAGNLVDRLSFRYVIDFIDMDLGFMHWPTYNVADIAISVGVVALIVNITFDKNSPLVSAKDKERRDAKKKAKAAAA